MNSALQGHKFEELEQLLEGIHDFLNEMQPSKLMFAFHHWIERMWWVIEHNGNYYHE
jgi:hypothetical protein